MTSQPGKKQLQYTLTNISRSRGNKKMKIGQLTEYNAEKLSTDPF